MPFKRQRVRLSEPMQALADELAHWRWEQVTSKGLRRDERGRPGNYADRDPFDDHRIGAWGEVAVYQFYGVEVNDAARAIDRVKTRFKAVPNVGQFEVRSRRNHDSDLLVRRDDALERPFVLTVKAILKGDWWLYGWWEPTVDGLKAEWRKDIGRGITGWFVPNVALHNPSTLPPLEIGGRRYEAAPQFEPGG